MKSYAKQFLADPGTSLALNFVRQASKLIFRHISPEKSSGKTLFLVRRQGNMQTQHTTALRICVAIDVSVPTYKAITISAPKTVCTTRRR